MKELTKKQQETISKNLRAFIYNFGPVKIIRQDYGPGFYVYSPADSKTYVHYCGNIDYLNGWLYGAVQALYVLKEVKKQ